MEDLTTKKRGFAPSLNFIVVAYDVKLADMIPRAVLTLMEQKI
jgi:hypothetical protein